MSQPRTTRIGSISSGLRSQPRRSSSWPRTRRGPTFGTISSSSASWTTRVRRPSPWLSCP
eukprot:3420339-Pyramimonas_sp.AAC.1